MRSSSCMASLDHAVGEEIEQQDPEFLICQLGGQCPSTSDVEQKWLRFGWIDLMWKLQTPLSDDEYSRSGLAFEIFRARVTWICWEV